MNDVIVVIGAGGGIGQALTRQLARQNPHTTVYALSRKGQTFPEADNIVARALETGEDAAIKAFCQQLREHDE
ncbi:NAD-dependent epimerase/dehydratase family protein [Salinimonas marina]|uniref:NAD-dependent epimerase/dehydratase family protein n=1 Tax=Salinimonas marina TaxID=2785918 RepID=UPI002FC33A6F